MEPMYELVIFGFDNVGVPRMFRDKEALVEYLHDMFPTSFPLSYDSSFATIHEFLVYSLEFGVLREIQPTAFERF